MTPADKKAKVRAVENLIAEGASQNAACGALGMSAATFGRWKAALAEAGGDAFEAFRSGQKGGRPKAVEFSDLEIRIARGHRLQKESLEWAMHFFLRDERVRPEIVATLRAIEERALERGVETTWPLSVRQAFRVSGNEFAAFRSGKAVQDVEMVSARGLYWIDEDGNPHDLLPGELWEADDYSTNQPFTYRDPITGKLDLGRQVLAFKSVVDQGWLGFDAIGRPRDAYRGEDIVRALGRCFRAHGVPRFLRLERGAWESSFIHGLAHDTTGKAVASDTKDAKFWGGLDEICHIVHVFKSKGKGSVEGGFNTLQRVLSHRGRDIGRYAGEFEEAAKAWRQARQNLATTDPTELGFLTQEESAAAHEEAANAINAKPMTRKALNRRVSPDDLRAELGWHTNPLPDAEAWRLLPYKERRVVRGGMIKTNPGSGWPELTFVINGENGLVLETGHAVFIAYDPADPEAAYVANADISARNRDGRKLGEFMAWAPLFQAAPQIDLSGERHSSIDYRKKAGAAAATEFRAVRGQLERGERERTATTGSRSIVAGDLERPERGEIQDGKTQDSRDGVAGRAKDSRSGRSERDRGGLATPEEMERLRREEEEALNNY